MRTTPSCFLTATFAGFPARAADLAETIRAILPETASLLFHDPGRERMELVGPGFIEYEAAGPTYRVGHFSFFQVNRFLCDELAATCGRERSRAAWRSISLPEWDFSRVPLAKHFEHVVAVESNPAAARDLEVKLPRRAAAASKCARRTSSAFLEKYKDKPDLVVLDPPRAGLDPGAAKRLLRIAPERITYVSCEPPTLARDLAALVQGGYEISGIHLFDLFPQTFHMETVVRLRESAS